MTFERAKRQILPTIVVGRRQDAAAREIVRRAVPFRALVVDAAQAAAERAEREHLPARDAERDHEPDQGERRRVGATALGSDNARSSWANRAQGSGCFGRANKPRS